MSELLNLTLSEASRLLKERKISSQELTQSHLNEIERADKILNAFITKTPDLAISEALKSDERYKTGSPLSALDGIPIAHKDVFCTKGIRTTAASKMLSNFVPPYESTVSENLKNAGTVLVGKVNTDEFAMGVSTITSHFGLTKNPWSDEKGNYTLVSGGSSGGPASAVSAGLCMGATGTDTGGSSRQPASFCGVVGMKPTYGRCSRWGIIAYASSLDQAGVLSRTVQDSALLLQHMAGYDHKDSTSSQISVPDFTSLLNTSIKGKRIGIPKEYRLEGLNSDVLKVWEKGISLLKEAGAEVIDISLPHTKYALPVYYIIAPAEASSNLSRYDGVRYTMRVDGDTLDELYTNTRTSGFGPEVQRRIFLGTFVLSAGFYDAYYTRALKVRRLIYNDFIEAYKTVDALLVPTAPTPALSQEEITHMSPVDTYLADVFTTPASLAGIPSISVPVGFSSKGLPIGLQVLGKHFDEVGLFQIAHFLEQGAQFPHIPHRIKGV